MRQVKFLVFADLHVGEFWCHDTQKHLDQILQRAEENQVDFIIHCGDFGELQNQQAAIDTYNNFKIPTYHVIGNHDTDFPIEKTMELFRLSSPYYSFDKNGFRFIVLDTNGMRINGEDILFSARNHRGKSDYFMYLTQEQIDWMEETIMSSPYPVVTFSHHNLAATEGNGLRNREDVMEMFRRVKAQGKKILLALNGHYHIDHIRVLEHTCYFDVNSATMFYNPESHNLFPEEYNRAHPGAKYCAIYNDPLSAIVTLTNDGTIEIEGAESSFFMGVSRREIAGVPYFGPFSQNITPCIKSEKLILP